MNLEKLKQKLIPIIKPYGIDVYSIRTKKEFGEKIVEILLDTDTININDLEKIHLAYIDILDDNDLDDDYYLELSSLGLERPIVNPADVEKAINRYVYLESAIYNGFGTLFAFEQNVMKIEINEKGRIRKIEIPFDQATHIRTAVKV